MVCKKSTLSTVGKESTVGRECRSGFAEFLLSAMSTKRLLLETPSPPCASDVAMPSFPRAERETSANCDRNVFTCACKVLTVRTPDATCLLCSSSCCRMASASFFCRAFASITAANCATSAWISGNWRSCCSATGIMCLLMSTRCAPPIRPMR